MKHLYTILLLLTALLPARAQQPGISFRGVEWTYNESSFIGTPFYALRKSSAAEAPRGDIIFTPGGDAWHFRLDL